MEEQKNHTGVIHVYTQNEPTAFETFVFETVLRKGVADLLNEVLHLLTKCGGKWKSDFEINLYCEESEEE